MDLEGIKAYIFDLDDTIYDESTYVSEAVSDVCKYLSSQYNIDYNKMYDFSMKSLLEDGRGHTFDNLCKEFSIDEDVKKLVKIYRECNPKLELYADAKELIYKIKKAGCFIGIITDGNTNVQKAKINSLGLFDLADAVIITDELKEDDKSLSKPDERVYKICLDKLNVKPEEAVYIGDNPLKDFVGAKKIGMKTIRIIRDKGMFMKEKAPEACYEADYIVKSLREII